jgi:hypothetical protein
LSNKLSTVKKKPPPTSDRCEGRQFPQNKLFYGNGLTKFLKNMLNDDPDRFAGFVNDLLHEATGF